MQAIQLLLAKDETATLTEAQVPLAATYCCHHLVLLLTITMIHIPA
jgi:hypothetical protein